MLSSITVGDAQGGADIEPERQWATEAGIEHQFTSRSRLDVAFWDRRVQHAADPNVFAGTTIIFPNAVAKGRAQGVDARLEFARDAGWSAYVNASTARVIQTGPITGGLFLEDEVEEIGPGVEFTPDHDQRFAAGAGVTWSSCRPRPVDCRDRSLRNGNADPAGRGRPRGVETAARRGDGGFRRRAREAAGHRLVACNGAHRQTGCNDHVTASVQVLNLFDERYAYNFGNPFSGTHFGAPRSVAFTVRVAFR